MGALGISRAGRGWFWATLMLSTISLVALVFAFWELVENRFFRDLDYVSLHYLYISRGVASSILLAFWAAWFVLRERRQAEEELRRSRERYRGLVNASPDAVALLSADRRVREWNASAERLYGYALEEVREQPLPTIPATHADELESQMTLVRAGNHVLEQESERVDRNGQHIQVQVSLLPFEERGELFFLEVTSDIRERVRLRQRLIEIEKLTSMGQMAAGTAHHLNTPLAAMLLRLQMMRARVQQPGFGEDLERLERSVNFCQQFVQRLLEFARRPSTRKERQQLRSIVDAALGFVMPTLEAKQVRVSCALENINGQTLLADRNELETVLLILLSNAADAITNQGSIEIRGYTRDHDVEITIADDGCGIPNEARARIFEPFFTTKPVGKGTGLGLAIARQIIRDHGGSIRLDSEAGHGTQAVIVLPTLSGVPAAAGAAS